MALWPIEVTVTAVASRVRHHLGYSEPSRFVDLLLTDACNLRYSYCPIWGEDSLPIQPFLADTAKLLGLVDELASFRPMIRFFGGEALLHPDWPVIVARARSHGIFCTGVSNGIRLARQADEMIASGLLAVGISLDGEDAENDGARGEAPTARSSAESAPWRARSVSAGA